jgi:mono/diheme cytochrome c family protein
MTTEESMNERKNEPMSKTHSKPRQFSVLLTSAAMLALLAQPVLGQGNSAALYKSKCASCHGADGTASATGKKLGAQDLQSPDVQKMSDADLSASITNGKKKMPPYAKALKPEDITGLVAYIRTLKK